MSAAGEAAGRAEARKARRRAIAWRPTRGGPHDVSAVEADA